MTAFDLVLSFRSGVLISGYSQVPEGLHGESARDRSGKPMVPATAIRGALREALEALLRGDNQGACAGGDGLEPGINNTTTETDRPCQLGEDGARCIACRLFGTRRSHVAQGESTFSGLVLGDGVLEGESAGWVDRPGVAIERRSRTASEKLLFLHRTAGGRQKFRAEGRLSDESLRQYLEAAALATTHVGSGKSRGLARVDLTLVPPKSPRVVADAEPSIHLALGKGDDLRVRVKLVSPGSFGAPVVGENVHDTRRFIPGSALRGAVGFALAETLADPNDGSFQSLVSAEKGARFGFLYPVDDVASDSAAPLPITAIECKQFGRKHGFVDTLLDNIATKASRTMEEAMAVGANVPRCTSPDCKSVRGAKGTRRLSRPLAVRSVTRAATDRTLRTTKDEALFTQLLVESGAEFEGWIRGIPPEGNERALLLQALRQPLSMGRGRSAGWGRVEITFSASVPVSTLEDRRKKFDAALEERLSKVASDLAADLVGRLIPVTLLAPLVPSEDAQDGADELVGLTGASGCFLRARRFVREGGWDQRTGKMETFVATAAGGVFVLEFADRAAADQALEKLGILEKQGVGQRRCQGYGDVLCFDPFILKRSFRQ